MNKTKLINIIKRCLILFKNNELNSTNYEIEISDDTICDYTNNYLSYKEIELICFLFQNFLYFQIPPVLNDFITKLKEINSSSKSQFITSLIEAYIESLTEQIERRINNEVYNQIFQLLHRFYQYGELDYEKSVFLLSKNLINPISNTGMDVAENYQYTQETLPDIPTQEEPLREQISKRNFSKNYSIENKTKKAITKYLNEESLTIFIDAINEIFQKLRQENPQEAELLEKLFTPILEEIQKSSLKSWAKLQTQEEDTYQLKLFA